MRQRLESEGLSGAVDWSKVSNQFASIADRVNAGNIGDRIDLLTSQYAALSRQLEQNFTGEELHTQQNLLQQTFLKTQEQLTSSYANRLQDTLSLSDADRQAIQDSLTSMMTQRISAYQSAQEQLTDIWSGTKDEWLLNDHTYMASQLRGSVNGASEQLSGNGITLGEVRQLGELSGDYQSIYQTISAGHGLSEGALAMQLSFADMKAEALIQQGKFGSRIADMFRTSSQRRQDSVLDAVDQQYTEKQIHQLSGEGPVPNVNRAFVREIYQEILSSFQNNGGNALAAMQNGVEKGKQATAKLHQQNPNVSRWGNSMSSYWSNFYTGYNGTNWHGGKSYHVSDYEAYA